MPSYAEVALPLGVDRTFTYLVPPELHDSAAVGCRTIVPFGRRYLTGLIIALPEKTEVEALKPLRDVLDSSPVVPAELLRLCRWIADYYFAPLGEVLKAALPHSFGGGGKRIIRPIPTPVHPAIPGPAATTGRGRILALLEQHGELSAAELQKHTGLRTINAILNSMEREQLILISETLPAPKGRPQTRRYIDLDAITPGMLTQAIASLSPRRKRSRRVLSYLRERIDAGMPEISVPDILRATGSDMATLQPFVEGGILQVSEREVTRQQEYGTDEDVRSIVLNATQRGVLGRITAAIDAQTHATFLLHGVTGSGKTQVYIEAIRHCLSARKTAIVLVPEIGLTPQIVRRFRTHFGDSVAVVHSRMSPGERHDVWRLALSGTCRVVIGPRSAIFAPLSDIGLIVVDEEHESTYKQYDAVPRYHARDTATVRGAFLNAVVVLGSATPSVESFYNVSQGKYGLLEMPERVEQVRMPDVVVVDMTEERRLAYAALRESLPQAERGALRDFQQSSVSALLMDKIADRLSRREGIILLQNRRGFAPFMECGECGYTESCDQCNVTLTYHLTKKHLRCHYCGIIKTVPVECPHCHGPDLKLRGIGTQRVEQELAELFPAAKVLRMDLDTTTRRGAHERILGQFGKGNADILLGTQMVAKGLDFGRVTLVGVISADTQMLLPDFRASERTFQLLTQVAGRAGRSVLQGEVVIQTHQARHRTLQHVMSHDYSGFYTAELEARRELGYPPFSRLVLLECKGEKEAAVQREAERLKALLVNPGERFTVLGPAPAVIARIRNQYRWHILLKTARSADPSGGQLRDFLRHAFAAFGTKRSQQVRLSVDVDPVGTL
jgi:primosomal protein N' (replication factor Y) (superfamily II helicase)